MEKFIELNEKSRLADKNGCFLSFDKKHLTTRNKKQGRTWAAAVSSDLNFLIRRFYFVFQLENSGRIPEIKMKHFAGSIM